MIIHKDHFLKFFTENAYTYTAIDSTISGYTESSKTLKGLLNSNYVHNALIFNDFYIDGEKFKITGSYETKTINTYGNVPPIIKRYFSRRGFSIEETNTIFEPILNYVTLLYDPEWSLLIPSRFIKNYNQYGTRLYNTIKKLSKYGYGIVYDFILNKPSIYVTFYDELKLLESVPIKNMNILDFLAPSIRTTPESIKLGEKLLQLESLSIQNYRSFTIIIDSQENNIYIYDEISDKLLSGELTTSSVTINNKEYHLQTTEIITPKHVNPNVFTKFISIDDLHYIVFNHNVFPYFLVYYKFHDKNISIVSSPNPIVTKSMAVYSDKILNSFIS